MRVSRARHWRLLFLLWLVPATASAQGERVEYYALDALGSVRVVFDAAGTVVGRMEYAPFGEELYNGLFVPAERFADLKRDGEAGFDYAQARLYQPRTARFSRPDPAFAGLTEPQLWNRYAYALNSPANYADPSGLCPEGWLCEEVTAPMPPPIQLVGARSASPTYAGAIPGGGGTSYVACPPQCALAEQLDQLVNDVGGLVGSAKEFDFSQYCAKVPDSCDKSWYQSSHAL